MWVNPREQDYANRHVSAPVQNYRLEPNRRQGLLGENTSIWRVWSQFSVWTTVTSGADKSLRAVLKTANVPLDALPPSSHQTRIPRVVPEWLAGSALLVGGCASNSSSRRCGRIEPGAERRQRLRNGNTWRIWLRMDGSTDERHSTTRNGLCSRTSCHRRSRRTNG